MCSPLKSPIYKYILIKKYYINVEKKNKPPRRLILRTTATSIHHRFVFLFVRKLLATYLNSSSACLRSISFPINTIFPGLYDFLVRGLLHTRKLLNQEFQMKKLKSYLRNFYGRYHKLVDFCGISVSHMTSDMYLMS